MLAALEAAKVPLKAIRANPAKTQAVTPALQALVSKSSELKVVTVAILLQQAQDCGQAKHESASVAV